MADQKRLVIIDGKSVFYRGFFAMPSLSNSAGQSTSGVYGFALLALKVLKDLKPDYVIVAWDKSKTNIRSRRKLYPAYKANRKPMPVEMKAQIPILRQLLDGFGWPLIELDDFEADDIMATLARQAQTQKLHTILVTSDLDILQAVDSSVEVCALKKGLTTVVNYTRDKFKAEYGMTPNQFIDYKALKGDSSDNVPGVAGIGDKTAKQLVQQYGSLDGVYKHLDEIAPTLRTKLEVGRDMAYLSHKLLVIRFDAPTKLDLAKADVVKAHPKAIAELFRDLEFRRLLTELPAQMQLAAEASTPAQPSKTAAKTSLQAVTNASQLADFKNAAQLVVLTTTNLNARTHLPEVAQVALSIKPNAALVITDPALFAEVKKILGSAKLLIGHNLKNDFKAWEFYNPQQVFDTQVVAWLLNPLFTSPSLSELAGRILDINLVDSQPTLMGDESLSEKINIIWQLHSQLAKDLKAIPSLNKLAHDIELPLIAVLAKMESFGVKLDSNYLGQMSEDFGRQIADVKDLIYKEAKQEFNISSPAQLALVLFDKLGLPTTGIKKGKTGYSTAVSELDKLRGLHPIINLITEYRELTKLKSTYVDSLPLLVDANGRLHTNLNQTVAPTGRLSSENPNLQNIPIRTEVGKEIRRAFIADPESTLVAADYSQFELRLAAVLAGDQNMIHAFNKGIDIHAMTAAEVYNLDDIEMVTSEQRRAAKTINFGVLYGLSAHGLSVGTGMSHEAATAFIDSYFAHRQKLLEYMEGLKAKAKKDGFVETMFGRRRPTPDVRSPNFMVRSAAERAAMNMPIQGTEADLMKMVMIEIDKKLDDDCHMLLQIHDSILVECPKSKSDSVSKLLKTTMENVYKLPVKLDVDVKTGTNWGEL